ncbi:unnamed protein product [Symbiodinium sp. KB8]|nr:unnamed protein product [Symbiodinium sp. KB8]
MFQPKKTIKSILKKPETSRLSQRAKNNIRKKSQYLNLDIPSNDEEGRLPDELKFYFSPMIEKSEKVESKITKGEFLIKELLHTLSDEKLTKLKEIYADKSQVVSEEKLVCSAKLIFDDVGLLDQIIPFLQNLRLKLVETYVDCYSNEYHCFKSSSAVFNNEGFVNDIEQVQAYRRGIKRATELSNESQPPPTNADGSGCPMM